MLYEYCVIYHDKDREPQILVPLTLVVARNEASARLRAAWAIPRGKFSEIVQPLDPDYVEIVVRSVRSDTVSSPAPPVSWSLGALTHNHWQSPPLR